MHTYRSIIERSRSGRLIPIGVLALSVLGCDLATAQIDGLSPTNRLDIQLLAPQQPNAPKRKDPAPANSVVISGQVTIEIGRSPTPAEVARKRYLVEYFLDNVLVFETSGSVDPATGKASLAGQLNAASYPAGKHKLVVNFWDDDGPSAIGIQHVIIRKP